MSQVEVPSVLSYELGRSTKVPPNPGSNSFPPDHDSTFHVIKMPAITTWPSVTSNIYPGMFLVYTHPEKALFLHCCPDCVTLACSFEKHWFVIWAIFASSKETQPYYAAVNNSNAPEKKEKITNEYLKDIQMKAIQLQSLKRNLHETACKQMQIN